MIDIFDAPADSCTYKVTERFQDNADSCRRRRKIH